MAATLMAQSSGSERRWRNVNGERHLASTSGLEMAFDIPPVTVANILPMSVYSYFVYYSVA